MLLQHNYNFVVGVERLHNHLERGAQMSFDYIIVGSGAGGSVLANRLSADSSLKVLVIEAGGWDRHPVHRVPKGFAYTMTNPKYTRKFEAGPFGPKDSVDSWFRGRVVGGSTTINGLIWNRGWAPDYEQLEQDNHARWGWDSFLATYRAIENFPEGSSRLHGVGGPVDIEVAGPPEEICEAFMAAGEAVGMLRVADVNGSDDNRTGYAQYNTRRGTRVSASRAFLHPALKRSNLTIITRAEVEQVVIANGRATGVRVRKDGQSSEILARREVVLCAGALETPLLLERSGIGRADVLKTAGIVPIVDSPNVGERLSEHRGIRFMYSAKGALGFNHVANTQPRKLASGAKYLVQRTGFIAQGSASVLTYFTAEDGGTRPDTIGFFSPVSVRTATLHDKRLAPADEPGMMAAFYPLRPTSTGSIHVTGPSLDDQPRIDPNFLSTERDRSLIKMVARKAKDLFAANPISSFVDEPLALAPRIEEDDELIEHALTAGASGYHTLGTCAMGPLDTDVVDAELRVRGVIGLRVVDASVFPYQPSGNTSAPTQALAWQAANVILGGS